MGGIALVEDETALPGLDEFVLGGSPYVNHLVG
jgi:hypothetical protein